MTRGSSEAALERTPGVSSRGACPHCAARVSWRQVLRVSRRVPYECPACRGRAAIAPRSGMLAVASFVAALAIPLFLLDLLGVPLAWLFAACLLASLALPLVLARACHFEAVRAGATDSIRSETT